MKRDKLLVRLDFNQFTASFKSVVRFILDYPVFTNLGVMWNFGFAAFVFLIIQLVTGFMLSMHYVAHADMAFVSVEMIMRDVNHGWLIRYMHANGASFFFMCVYLHMIRSIYYTSYFGSRKDTWIVGVVIFILLIVTAFTGYVLPWGQMSFWAATVVTNLFSAVPFYGQDIVHWLWGGYSVSSFTLTRFFSIHFVLPFIILGLVILHIVFLHINGGNNRFNVYMKFDKVRFFPYYFAKDLYYTNYIMLAYLTFIGFAPNYLLHVDNYIEADPLITPSHIVPEWYFLIFYAMLRSVPSKVGGILVLLLSILVLFTLPYLKRNTVFSQEVHFNWSNRKFLFLGGLHWIWVEFLTMDWQKFFCWCFIVNCALLGFIGSQPIEYPYLGSGRVFTLLYFVYFIILYFLNKNAKLEENAK
jgi:ubiquinol-cytochrome c reductase cytochrome b subunit